MQQAPKYFFSNPQGRPQQDDKEKEKQAGAAGAGKRQRRTPARSGAAGDSSASTDLLAGLDLGSLSAADRDAILQALKS